MYRAALPALKGGHIEKTKDVARIAGILVSVYLFWIGLNALLLAGFNYLPLSVSSSEVAANCAILFFIGAAFFVTSSVFSRLNPRATIGTTVFRSVFIAAIGVHAAIYMAVSMGVKNPFIYAAATANLIVFSWILASFLATGLKKPSELVPLCVIVALTDIFSVAAGPTSHMVEDIGAYYEGGAVGMPPLVDFILMKAALPGYEGLVPMFGVSDWVIVAFFYAAVLRFGLNDNMAGGSPVNGKALKRRRIYIPAAVTGLGLAVIIARMSGTFIPALPVLAVLFLSVALFRNPEVRMLQKREWLFTAGAVIVMGGVAGAMKLFG